MFMHEHLLNEISSSCSFIKEKNVCMNYLRILTECKRTQTDVHENKRTYIQFRMRFAFFITSITKNPQKVNNVNIVIINIINTKI